MFASLQIALSANTANFSRGMKKSRQDAKKTSEDIKNNFGSASSQVSKSLEKINRQIDNYRKKIEGYHKGVAVVTAAVGGLTAAYASMSKIVDVQREFDKLNASLITVTGSSANAAAAMEDLKKFAKETPFGLSQAVDGFVKLKALGLTPSIDALTSFGNTASAMGKDLNQMIEAVADAATFEFERLKEFGIKANQEKNSVSFTFQGITTTVGKNAKEIEQYLTNIGNVQFAGAMAERMKTLDGAIASLGDSWNELLLKIGNYKVFDTSVMDLLAAAARRAGDAIDWLSEHLNIIVAGISVLLATLASRVIATATSTAAAWVASSAAKVRANIAEAASLQAQSAMIYNYQRQFVLLRLTKTHYINTIKETTKATLNYVRALPNKITAIKQSTLAMINNTRAMFTKANALKALTASASVASRGIISLGGAFASMGRLILANPIMTIAAIISAIIVRTMGLQKAMDSLSDAIDVVGELFGRLVDWGIDGFGNLLNSAGEFLSGFLGQSESTTGGVTGYFSQMFAGTKGGFVGLIQVAASAFDRMSGFAVGCVRYMLDNFNRFKNQAINLFISLGNAIGSYFSSRINTVIDGLNWVNGKLGGDADYIPHWQFTPGSMTPVSDVQFSATGGTNFRGLVDDAIGTVDNKKKNQGGGGAGSGAGGSGAGGADKGKSGKGGKGGKGNGNHKPHHEKQEKPDTTIQDALNEMTVKNAKLEYEAKQLLNNVYSDMLFEISDEYGKFYKATKEQKQALLQLAKEEDLLTATKKAHDEFKNIGRTLKLIGKENPFDALLYDLYDVRNELSVLDEQTKQNWLLLEAQKQSAQVLHELKEKTKELSNEAALVNEQSEYRRELLQIEQETTKTLEKYAGLNQGNTKQVYEQIIANHKLYEIEQKKLATEKAYLQIKADNQNEEEKQLQTLTSQLDVLTEQAKIVQEMGGDTYAIETLSKKLITDAIGLPELSNPYGDLADEAVKRQNLLDAGIEQLLKNEQLNEEQRISIKRWGAAERERIEKNYQDSVNRMILTDSENMFGSLASIARDGLGEQSKVYRAMFAMQQGFAIVQATMAMQQAISQGLAKGFPMGLADMALAAAEGAKIVSAIKSVVMPVGQAHDGIMSVPKSGTWNLEKGERVLPKHTAKALDKKLDSIGGGGGTAINISVTVNSNGSSDVQSDAQAGKSFGNAIKAAVQNELMRQRRQGGMLYGV
ncbi:tape measure protein [Moraxella sp. ZJ142]|uniref:tape measure protein n=1 Tax=Moraxella marmotae TaxID=3344520 RepID=UPI0035D4A559